MLAEALAPFGPLQYHGKVPHGAAARRSSTASRATRRKHVLLMSYGTGSVGLNLQFTNYVFLFDRWWNPAVEDQAINRAHRIGQKDPVFVTRFVTREHDRGPHRRGAGGEAAALRRADRAERPAAGPGADARTRSSACSTSGRGRRRVSVGQVST